MKHEIDLKKYNMRTDLLSDIVTEEIDGIGKKIVKEEDIPFLAQSAYDDACRPGNPKETSVADIAELYRSLLK